MKHIRHRSLLEKLDSMADVFPEIAKLTLGIDYLELMLTYSLTAIDKDDKMKLEKILKSHLNQESGDKLMTSLAHHWEQEGVEKGILQGMKIGEEKGVEIGIEQTAINMLKQGLDPRLVAQCTGLPPEKIQMLKY